MIWKMRFADRTAQMQRSTVREFLKRAAQPGMISFAGGLPAPELFPIQEIRAASERILTRHGSKALQYGETEGVAELRAWLATRHGVGVENVLVTSGAQQALDLIGRVLLNPGDQVGLENPTYLALLLAWRPHGVNFSALQSHEAELDPGRIDRDLKLCYLIPNFQNPQGTTLSLSCRKSVAEKALQEQLPIVEDDPYGELRYDGEPLPSLFSLASAQEGPVIHVGTFSKILAPGLRVGWIIGGADLIDRLVLAKQPMDLHTSTWNQYLALELATSGFLPAHVERLRREYKARRDTMLRALGEFMPAHVQWSRPEGGMFLFVQLPPEDDAAELAKHAAEEKVLVVPGADFHLSGGRNTFRLNFSNAQPEAIRLGISKLAGVVKRLQPSARPAQRYSLSPQRS